MVNFQAKTRRAMFACTASVLALTMAAPGFAQTAPAATAPADGGSGQASGDAQDQSKDIIVNGIRASIQASLDAKRDNDMVSEVVTAQDIGKFPDKNVADSLGRLTGVNVVTGSASAGGFGENQSVSIRGTDPTLNLTLLDGHSVATGDWFVLDQTSGGRSFDFSLLPSEIVGKLEVYKSSEADLVEGGIGGTINLYSRRPLDLPANSFSLTAQANYNDLADKVKPQVSGLYSWKNQDGTFGILLAGYYQEREFRRDGPEFLGYTTYNNFAGTNQTVTAPNLIGAAYFTQKRVRKGGTVALQYKPNDQFEVTLNGIYTRMDANNVNRNSMAWISRVIGNNSTPGIDPVTGLPRPYALANYSVTNGYLTAASWNALDVNGNPIQGRVQDDIFRDAYSSTWVINLETKWNPTDRLTLSGEVGYTKGEGATKDTYAWETYWNTGVNYAINGKGAAVNYPGLPTDPTSAAYLNNYYSWSWGGRILSPDSETYVRADAEYKFDGDFLKSIKIGGRYTNHKRAVDYTAYSWPGNGLYSGTNTIGLGTVYAGGATPDNFLDGMVDFPPYTVADKAKVLAELATNGGRIFDFYPQASFSVKEKTEAVYAMAKLGSEEGSWRGNIGVRAVRTELETTQYTPNPLAAGGLERVNSIFCPLQADGKNWCDTNHVNRSYWDILPSANLTFKAAPNLLLRASAARTMTRPGYAQLAGAFTVSDLALTGTAGGNPYLNPTRAWNFNVAAEYYYARQALFSVNLFYLDIDSYVTSTTTTRFLITQQHPAGANFLIQGPVNGQGGTNKGVEINWQQPIYGGFGLLANYTYADAKASNGDVIDGASKHTFNVTAYYENSLISTRFAYTFRSKFRSGIDRATPMWQADFGTLDGSLTINLTKNFALTADAQNLLNHKLYYFVGDPSIPRAYYNNGRTFWIGGKVHF
ncbi:MAG: TonB-dependent receptor [Sphingomonas sp.]|uniref:TonB-dependent receptor n=1 Tax=Sphingomonas sp. TaxID=28214 RepID=UPI003F7CDF43